MKKPLLAFILSLILPGAGIMYLGQWLIGLINLIVVWFWFSLIFTSGHHSGELICSLYFTHVFISGWVAMTLASSKNLNTSIAKLEENLKTKQEAASDISDSDSSHAIMCEAYLGQIQLFASNYAPKGWALCEGQHLKISENMALFALLGNKHGGDGVHTFALPNLKEREVGNDIRYYIALLGVFPSRE